MVPVLLLFGKTFCRFAGNVSFFRFAVFPSQAGHQGFRPVQGLVPGRCLKDGQSCFNSNPWNICRVRHSCTMVLTHWRGVSVHGSGFGSLKMTEAKQIGINKVEAGM